MNISRWFLLGVLALPIAEIYLLIKLLGSLGFLPTLALLLGAAALGSLLLRTQGWWTWLKVQQALARGELPAREMVEGGLIALAGVLLLIPGFISDGLALFCLLPATRRRLADRIIRDTIVLGPRPATTGPDRQHVIEGEFKRDD